MTISLEKPPQSKVVKDEPAKVVPVNDIYPAPIKDADIIKESGTKEQKKTLEKIEKKVVKSRLRRVT